jgi:PAS domain S-box-containing protein
MEKETRMEKLEAFPRRLRAILAAKRISNKELASRVGTDVGTVSRWLMGKHTPSRRRLELIESAIGVPQGTLLGAESLVGIRHEARQHVMTSQVVGGGPIMRPHHNAAEEAESANQVLIEFNRWLDSHLANDTPVAPIRVAEWMYRMWRTCVLAGGTRPGLPLQTADPHQLLDFNVPPDTGVAIVNEHGRIVTANDALVEILDVSREQVMGQHEWDLFAPEYRSAIKHRLRLSVVDPIKAVILTADGRRIPVRKTTFIKQLAGHTARVILVEPLGTEEQCFIGVNGD